QRQLELLAVKGCWSRAIDMWLLRDGQSNFGIDQLYEREQIRPDANDIALVQDLRHTRRNAGFVEPHTVAAVEVFDQIFIIVAPDKTHMLAAEFAVVQDKVIIRPTSYPQPLPPDHNFVAVEVRACNFE